MLYILGALNDKGQLTKLGSKMAEFPCDPMMSKCIIHSEKHGCVAEVITICAMLDCGNAVYFAPKERKKEADNAKLGFARGTHV